MGLLGVALPQTLQAQDTTTVVAEGHILNEPLKRLYFYRINADSTVLIRQEKPRSSAAGVRVPATTLASIYDRTEEQLLSAQWASEYLVLGYEDQSLVLRFSQRFDLYVLGTLIFVVVVGGSLLAWLWWRLSREQRRREALAQSRRYLTEGREKERERLAQEIHDGPVQDLHGLHMQLNALPDTPSPDRVQEMGDELMRVTSELRAMSADLHPPTLQRFGLAAALRSHADRLQERHPSVQIDMDLPDEQKSVPDATALSHFRIAQEAMNNAVQHGQAHHLHVRLHTDRQILEVAVQDDGVGFTLPDDWYALAKEDHYGLLGMRERAEAINAELDIESAPGEGTRVQLRSSIDESASVDNSSREAAPVPA